MGIIFIFLFAIITGGAYSLSQIQQIENSISKCLLTAIVVIVELLMLVVICKWVWPRRNIN
jgi:membrane protein DedA with SNARE-associated domain